MVSPAAIRTAYANPNPAVVGLAGKLMRARVVLENTIRSHAANLGIANVPTGDMDRMLGDALSRMAALSPDQIGGIANNANPTAISNLAITSLSTVYGNLTPEQKAKLQALTPANDTGTPKQDGAFDSGGNLIRLARLGAGSAAALAARGARDASGAAYREINAAGFDGRNFSSLTADNFSQSDFARAGLDYSTTMRLAAQGFTPTAIKQAASLTRDLGIGTNKHVEAVARLKRDVRGIEGALLSIKDLDDSYAKAQDAAREARARGDMAAAAEHQRRADELRRQRDEKIAREREEVKKQNPERVKDFDDVAKGIVGSDKEIRADLEAGKITPEEAEKRRAKRARRATPNSKQIRADARLGASDLPTIVAQPIPTALVASTANGSGLSSPSTSGQQGVVPPADPTKVASKWNSLTVPPDTTTRASPTSARTSALVRACRQLSQQTVAAR